MSRWQGRWLVGMWLLLPGSLWAWEPLLIPRAAGGSSIAADDAPLKLTRAASSTSRTTGAGDSSRTKPAGWTTTTASLLLVLTLIVGVAYVLRRQGGRIAGLLPDEVVQVLGRRYLDQRNSVQLVRCGSKILVLAQSPQFGLTTLSEISDPQEVEAITRQCAPEGTRATSLLGRLRADSPHPHPYSSASSGASLVGTMPRAGGSAAASGGARG